MASTGATRLRSCDWRRNTWVDHKITDEFPSHNNRPNDIMSGQTGDCYDESEIR